MISAFASRSLPVVSRAIETLTKHFTSKKHHSLISRFNFATTLYFKCINSSPVMINKQQPGMNLKNLILCCVLLCLVLSACNENHFKHDIETDAKPWSETPEPSGDSQVMFAVIGDLNSGYRPGVIEIAAQQMSLLKPKFILSIGDLIEGGGEDSAKLKTQYDELDARVAKAGAPFFHVGGNHDLTSPKTRSLWEQNYGRRYYHFIYENMLFLVIDSEDYSDKRMMEIFHARNRAIELLDSGKTALAMKTAYFAMPERVTGEVSDAQSDYFEKVIEQNSRCPLDVRVHAQASVATRRPW
jgi:hypothetical protein